MPTTTGTLTVTLGDTVKSGTYTIDTGTPEPPRDGLTMTMGPCPLGYTLAAEAPDLRTMPDGSRIAEHCHLGNLHSYFRGERPELEMDDFRDMQVDFCPTNTLPDNSRTPATRMRSSSWLFKKPDNRALPIVITETGYSYEDPGEDGVPTDVGETYAPRASLEYARVGVYRAYFFQLFDDQGEHYGMFEKVAAVTPRGVAKGIHNLTSMLRDPGATRATFTPTALTLDVIPPTGKALRWQLYQKSDMSWWLAMWRPDSIWDTRARTRITLNPARLDVTVKFNTAKRVRLLADLAGDDPNAGRDLGSDTEHVISVGSRVTFLKITNS